MNDPPKTRDCSSGQACPRMEEAGDAHAPGKGTPCLVGPRRSLARRPHRGKSGRGSKLIDSAIFRYSDSASGVSAGGVTISSATY